MKLRGSRYSIVMPTYNRGHLIGGAITSVLGQRFEDFELIVSDGGSTDNTRAVVKGFNDDRIRYFASDVRLSIGDNYEFALSKAGGEYVTFLSDDDAFSPAMLSTVEGILNSDVDARLVGFRYCHYNQEEYREAGSTVPPNSLELLPYTGKINKFSGSESLRLLYGLVGLSSDQPKAEFIVPYLANAVYHHSIFDAIRKRRGKLFEYTPADMYLAAAVFYATEYYLCLDAPLHVWARWSGSATAVPGLQGNNLRSHYEKLLNGGTLEFTPLKYPLPENCGANAILAAGHDFQEMSGEVALNWHSYYCASFNALMNLEKVGINVNIERDEFLETLQKEPAQLQDSVGATLSRNDYLPFRTTFSHLRYATKETIRQHAPAVIKMIRFLLGRNGYEPVDKEIVTGAEAGFSNIVEAAEYLDKRFKTFRLESQ